MRYLNLIRDHTKHVTLAEQELWLTTERLTISSLHSLASQGWRLLPRVSGAGLVLSKSGDTTHLSMQVVDMTSGKNAERGVI